MSKVAVNPSFASQRLEVAATRARSRPPSTGFSLRRQATSFSLVLTETKLLLHLLQQPRWTCTSSMILYNQTGNGTYWRAIGFAKMLAQRGHAVTLICTSPCARLRSPERGVDDVRLVEMPDLLNGSLRSGRDAWIFFLINRTIVLHQKCLLDG